MSDIIKWLLVGVLVSLGISAHYFYAAMATSKLLLGWVFVLIAGLAIASTTNIGRSFVGFARDANIELKKVVWPTRQETLQMTLIVMGVVLVMGLVLWMMDSVLLYIVGTITGQKG